MKEYYAKRAVSNSGMKFINPEEGGSPARYKKYIIDGEKEEESTPSLENGKLVHLYVEDPEAFIISDVERPTPKLAEWAEEVHRRLSNLTEDDVNSENVLLRETALEVMPKYGSTTDKDKLWTTFNKTHDYLKHLIASTNDLCITSAQKEVVESCVNSLLLNSRSAYLLFGKGEETFGVKTYNELAVYWEEVVEVDKKEVKVPCKGLIDRLIVYPGEKRVHLVDLKTTGKPISKFSSSFEYYRYYRQMAWYMRAVAAWMAEHFPDEDLKEWKMMVSMVVVETYGLHECKVFDVDSSWTSKGGIESIDLLGRIAIGMGTGNWTDTIEEMRGGGVIKLVYEEG